MKKIILLAMIIGSLTGCASVPPLNFSTPNVGVSQKKIDAEIKSLTVSLARPDEQKGDITAGMEAITPIWGNDSNLLIVFYVQIIPDDFVMQLHRF
ncbi:hypothetical protein V5O65_22200 [Escherichia coli]|uniref:hypothetical protein n=1 Tax=Escherichia coli TaxID=562 RepID=UPI003FA328E0